MLRLRIGLKWFLLGTTFAGVLLGIFGKRFYDDWQVRQRLARQRERLARQQAIADKLKDAGGFARMRDGHVWDVYLSARRDPTKLMALVSDAMELECFAAKCPVTDAHVALLHDHVKLREVHISGPGLTNRSLAVLGKLPQLKRLYVFGARANDDGLGSLRGLKELEELWLGALPMDGNGFAHLADLPKLRRLDLTGSLVTDNGLAGLAKCKSLESVQLGSSRITGRGLGELGTLPKLRQLTLHRMELSNGESLDKLDNLSYLIVTESRLKPGFLAQVATMEKLRRLELRQCAVGDELLKELRGARQIEYLHLDRTSASDAAIMHLQELKQLRELRLRNSHVTESGARDLSQHLPNTAITCGNGIAIVPQSRPEAQGQMR